MLIVDTGPLVAAANRGDEMHDACKKLLTESAELLVLSLLSSQRQVI